MQRLIRTKHSVISCPLAFQTLSCLQTYLYVCVHQSPLHALVEARPRVAAPFFRPDSSFRVVVVILLSVRQRHSRTRIGLSWVSEIAKKSKNWRFKTMFMSVGRLRLIEVSSAVAMSWKDIQCEWSVFF